MRTIKDIIEDIVSCADEADGGKVDAWNYCAELVAVVTIWHTTPTITARWIGRPR